MTIVPLFTSSLLTGWAITHEQLLAEWPLETWMLATIGLAVASALALSPPTFLALVYGYFLGWIALPFLFLLNLMAILVVYTVARRMRSGSMLLHLQRAYPQVHRLLQRFEENQLRLIFFAKLSPVLPFAVTNLFFVLAGAQLRQVLLGGTLGMVPRTVLAVWVGLEAREISYLLAHPNEDLASKLLLIVLIIASTLGIAWFFKKKK
ncbi:hypothetical protein EZE20_01415 [Arundinibacter roseus]|uniref:VTT domain-containing protein n=1 Tax=Arundinibacter roseus TaxID=2070510 RepID=A0A4R4KRG3_9BACT|nr:hypothetical protein EZE20_01415 [Arundinibacter roseus]